jgi:hypothetical protein
MVNPGGRLPETMLNLSAASFIAGVDVAVVIAADDSAWHVTDAVDQAAAVGGGGALLDERRRRRKGRSAEAGPGQDGSGHAGEQRGGGLSHAISFEASRS